MNPRDLRAHYAAGAASTASPARLVTLLFDGALAAVSRARRVLETDGADGPEQTVQIHLDLTRAQDIVLELRLALDHERGGVIADSLDALYGFCLERLLMANVAKNAAPLREVARVLEGLREGWSEAAPTMPAA